MKGLDFGYGKIKGSQIKQQDYDFVCRYLSHSPGKNITRQELDDFKANGLQVVLVWETTETRIDSGFQGGLEDAKSALNEIRDLGIAVSLQVIYFAVDEDIGSSQYLRLHDYLKGVNSLLGPMKTGVYGGLATIRYAFDNNLVKYGWQTLAWSHGKWDMRAQLRQTKTTGLTIAGVSCDLNESMNDDFGQLRY